MIILQILTVVLLLGFIFWVGSHLYSTIFHVPYVNSSDRAIRDALNLAELKLGDDFLDLGCGRGDALIIAARDFNATAVGYEISPLPYLLAKIRTFGNPDIKIYRRNFRNVNPNLKKADVIYLYLLNSVLDKIEDQLFSNLRKSARIVSLSFRFKKHKPQKVVSTNNLAKETKIYLYTK